MKDFLKKLNLRIQKTVLHIFSLGFLSWVIGTILVIKKIIPCDNIAQFGIYTGALLVGIGIRKKAVEKL